MQVLNLEGLRNKKEFVNHKILRLHGRSYIYQDIKLLEKIVCSQGGHMLTNKLLRRVFEQNENFTIIERLKKRHIPHYIHQ